MCSNVAFILGDQCMEAKVVVLAALLPIVAVSGECPMCVHVCMYICICVCVYIYIKQFTFKLSDPVQLNFTPPSNLTRKAVKTFQWFFSVIQDCQNGPGIRSLSRPPERKLLCAHADNFRDVSTDESMCQLAKAYRISSTNVCHTHTRCTRT